MLHGRDAGKDLAHRRPTGVVVLGRGDHADLPLGHHWPHLTAKRPDQDPHGPHARVHEIHVWMRVIADDGVGRPHLPIGQVAMHIEADDDRQRRPDDLSHGRDQLTLWILRRFGRHRPVQGQDHAVDPSSLLSPPSPTRARGCTRMRRPAPDGTRRRRRPRHGTSSTPSAWATRRTPSISWPEPRAAPNTSAPSSRYRRRKSSSVVTPGTKVFTSCLRPARKTRGIAMFRYTRNRGSSTSRSPSPKKLTASTVAIRTSPGKVVTCHAVAR